MFIGLLTGLVSASNHRKCASLSDQKCEIQHLFINLYPNEYSQVFHYYPFTVKLDKCVGSSNILNDWSYLSFECNCKVYKRKCNSN